jgi:hypothetical protein
VAGELNVYGYTGLILESAGSNVTDIYGLETCTAVFKAVDGEVPAMFTYHPIFTWLHLERRRVDISPEGFRGFTVTTAEFAGISGPTVPIYELDLGLSEEPIETHPLFVSDIAGTASAPLNGAIFVDESTGRITSDEAHAVFSKFQTTIGGVRNPFAGISAYLDFSNSIWRKTQMLPTNPADLTTLGKIATPDGPVPALDTGQDWLFTGMSYVQRGLVFSVKWEWRASGRRGWNETIYGVT